MKSRSLTKLVGIFGDPIAHTRSPAMQNAAFAALGLNYYYAPFAVHDHSLRQAVHAIRALGLVGVNITIPHKERVIGLLDDLSPEARLIGAVNTVVNRRGMLIGHNTDGRGFLLALRRKLGLSVRGRTVCLLGAGGAARAVAVALVRAGVNRLVIANRTLSRAETLTRQLRSVNRRAPQLRAIRLSAASLAQQAGDCDCLINATAVGMNRSDPQLVSPAIIRQFSYVCDLIYNPAKTRLLRDAEAAGCRTMNGLPMLVYQGALAFQLWTGRTAPVRVMERAAASLLDS